GSVDEAPVNENDVLHIGRSVWLRHEDLLHWTAKVMETVYTRADPQVKRRLVDDVTPWEYPLATPMTRLRRLERYLLPPGHGDLSCDPTSFPAPSSPTMSFRTIAAGTARSRSCREAIPWCCCSPAAASVRKTGDSTKGSCSCIGRCRSATAD